MVSLRLTRRCDVKTFCKMVATRGGSGCGRVTLVDLCEDLVGCCLGFLQIHELHILSSCCVTLSRSTTLNRLLTSKKPLAVTNWNAGLLFLEGLVKNYAERVVLLDVSRSRKMCNAALVLIAEFPNLWALVVNCSSFTSGGLHALMIRKRACSEKTFTRIICF